MEPQTRRTLIAIALCLIVMFGWVKLMEVMYPPRPAPVGQTAEATTQPSAITTDASAQVAESDKPATQTPTPVATGLSITSAAADQPITLGDDQDRKSVV